MGDKNNALALSGENMANDTTANVNVNVNSNIKDVSKDAEVLYQSLKAAAAAAKSLRVPGPTRAAQAGLNASNPSRDSGLGRAVGVGKGAGARDFAEQAQGLGGLVRVYATFAANIFAVSAAFTALSRAYDTANLVKGLDQLGAASGRNLGSLSKQLVEATDGAISLREAMKATASATSAGLSGANLLRLGTVAKQAAQALGVDMSNAVDRLSRGITKLEPELLDELGIFTRVDKANADYARSIGKSASALTDFEKRQAFANAVLAEGEAKFSNIKIDANPYTKILASLDNLSQSGLNVINKILTPITTILSTSPLALGVAIAGFAQVLLKQAVPALSQWREGLDKAAKSARNNLVEANRLRKEKIFAKDSEEGQAIGNAALAASKAAEQALKSAQTKAAQGARKGGFTKDTGKLIPDNILKINDSSIAELEKQADRIEKASLRSSTSPNAKARLEDEAKGIRTLTAALKEQVKTAEAVDKLDSSGSPSKVAKFLSYGQSRERLADKANQKSLKADILNNTSKGLEVNGVTGSLANLFDATAKARKGFNELGNKFEDGKKSMTRFTQVTTNAAGTIQILGSAFSSIISSLSGVLIGITVLVGVFQLLDSVWNTSAKQAAEYTSSLEALESSIDNVGRTLEFISNKKGAAVISPESIQASANAFNDLSENTNRAAVAFQKLKQAESGWDSFFDGLFDIVGKGSADKLATQLSNSIAASLKLVENGPAKEAAKKTFADLVGVDPTNTKALETALRKLTDPEIASKAQDIAKAVSGISREANNVAATLTAAVQGIKDTSKLVNDLNNTLKPTDIQGKLGDKLVSESFGISKALQEPISGLATLKAAVEDVNFLSLIDPKSAKELLNVKNEIEDISKALGDAKNAREKAEAELSKAPKEVKRSEKDPIGAAIFGDSTLVKGASQELKDAVAAAIAQETKLKAQASALVTNFASFGDKVLNAGVDKLLVSLKGAFEQGGIEAARGYLSVIKAAGGRTADQEARLKQQELGIQLKNIEAQFAQIKQAAILTVAMEESANATKILSETLQLQGAGTSEARRDAATKSLDLLNQDKAKITAKKALLDTSGKGLINTYSTFAKSDNAALKGAAVDLAGYFTQAIGVEGQKAGIAGKGAAIEAQRKAGVLQEEADAKKKLIDQDITTITLQKEQLSTSQEILGFFDEEYARKKLQLDQSAAQAAYDKERIDSETKIAQLKIGLGTSANQKTLTADIATAEAEAAKKASDFEKKRSEDARKSQFEIAKGLDALAEKDAGRKAKIFETDNQIAESRLALDSSILSSRQALGTISDENAAIEQASLDTTKAKLDKEKETFQVIQAREALERSTATKMASATTSSDKDKISADSKKENDLLDAQSIKITEIYNNKIKTVDITKTQSLEQAKVNEHLREQQAITETLTDVTKGLADVFGDVGTAIGEVAKAFIDSAEKQYQINERLAKDRKKFADPKDSVKLAKIESKAAYEIADSKLAAEQSVLTGAKKIFGEKTKLGKALAAAEKAYSIVRLALSIKELGVQLGIISTKVAGEAAMTAATVTGSATRTGAAVAEAGVNATAGVIEQAKGDPYTAFARMAAMAAAMAVLMGAIGGKSPKAPGGFNAKEQQEVQGTGQKIGMDGKLVDRAGGVLGDSSAKSEDIANSIDLLEKHTFKDLEYSNSSLNALKAIQKNTDGLATLLLSVPGLKSGSGFGTVEGTSTAKINPVNFATGLTKTSKEIVDAGIKINGTFGDILNGAGKLTQYENVKTSKSSFLGIVKKDSFSTQEKALEGSVVDTIRNMFQSAADAITTIGSDLFGKSQSEIFDSLSKQVVDFKASTKGLTGDELTKALQAEMGIAVNAAIESVYPFITEFQKIGEGLLTTLSRLDADNNAVNRIFEAMGIGYKEAAAQAALGAEDQTVATVRMSESIIELAGGLDAFVENSTKFTDSFLTDAEKLAPVQKAVTAEMARLGFSSITTKEQFKDLVLGLNLTTVEGQTTYANLISVSEAFDKVATHTKEFEENVLGKQLQILRATGNVTKAINVEREREIDKLRLLSDAESEVLIPLQQTIYAKEDEAKLLKQTTALLQAQGRTYEVLLINRQEELNSLTEAEQTIRKLVYAVEDANKVFDKQLILMDLVGQFQEAEVARRNKLLATMSEEEKAVQILIYAQQDGIRLKAIESEIASALGFSYNALIMSREKELLTLTDSERALKKYLYVAQDQAKTDALGVELIEAQGDAAGALNAKRKLELRGLSATDQSLKVRIYRLQDEKKLLDQKNSQEVKIYNLLGNSAAALAITRKQELEAMDAQLRPAQEYIYALEDELTLKDQLQQAYEKESSSLKETVKALKSSSQALKDYRDSLLVGDKSILNPTQKYAEAKSQALRLAAIAQGPANTAAEIEARDNAISKLPSATDTWLEASRNLYASSETYTQDFGMALDILDTVSGALDSQQTDAEKQLSALDKQVTILDIIKDNTASTSTLLAQYLTAKGNTEAARVTSAASGSVASGGTNINPTAAPVAATLTTGANGQQTATGITGTTITKAQLTSITEALVNTNPEALYDLVVRKQGITSQMYDSIMGYAPGTALAWALSKNLPGFANGGLAQGLSIVGEKGPELVNFPAPARVFSNSQSNAMMGNNQALVDELKNLKQELVLLRQEQKEQTGHLIASNYDANSKAADKLVAANDNDSDDWKERNKVKLA